MHASKCQVKGDVGGETRVSPPERVREDVECLTSRSALKFRSLLRRGHGTLQRFFCNNLQSALLKVVLVPSPSSSPPFTHPGEIPCPGSCAIFNCLQRVSSARPPVVNTECTCLERIVKAKKERETKFRRVIREPDPKKRYVTRHKRASYRLQQLIKLTIPLS